MEGTVLNGSAAFAGADAIEFPAISYGQSEKIKIGHLTPLTGFLGALGAYAQLGTPRRRRMMILELFKVFDLLRRHTSIVIVEHNLDLVLALADRVFALERGAVFHQGPAVPLLTDLE